MKRLIVTGGNGFIGGHLVKKLLESNQWSLVLIANRHSIDRETGEPMPLRFYAVDIRDRDAISNIFRDERPNACIHLAAKISVADSIRKPDETMDINANGTLNVLEACHKAGVNNFIFASSAAVYGDVKKLPITEDQMLRPLSPYGSSKMLAEQYVYSYQKQNKIKNTISLRIFNAYGEGQASEADVISKFAKKLMRGQAPVIFGNGMQTRDFISVVDVVEAIILSIKSMEGIEKIVTTSPSVYNVGTGIPTSINQVAQKMIEIFGLDLHPIYKNGQEGESGILHSYADITAAKKNLHFVAKKGIERGLREIIEPIIKEKFSLK